MDDLISRQAAIDAINTWDKFGVDERNRVVKWHEGLEPYIHLRDVVTAITNLPSAQIDVVCVVHGRWIIRDNPGTGWYRITCSECGEDVTATAPCIGFVPNAKVNWNYCPECGARMDEERNNND